MFLNGLSKTIIFLYIVIFIRGFFFKFVFNETYFQYGYFGNNHRFYIKTHDFSVEKSNRSNISFFIKKLRTANFYRANVINVCDFQGNSSVELG